jgi:adenine phosphoribosyltransferase
MDLKPFIRDVPDFPKPGIVFKDITPLLRDPGAFRASVSQLAERFRDEKFHRILGIESRGFIFGAALAHELGVSFIPVRKPGKLPWKRASVAYDLEYGSDAVEIHTDAVDPGDRILVIDDLLATGGTVAATAQLVEQLGGEVAGCGFVIELGFLDGRKAIEKYRIESLVEY